VDEVEKQAAENTDGVSLGAFGRLPLGFILRRPEAG